MFCCISFTGTATPDHQLFYNGNVLHVSTTILLVDIEERLSSSSSVDKT